MGSVTGRTPRLRVLSSHFILLLICCQAHYAVGRLENFDGEPLASDTRAPLKGSSDSESPADHSRASESNSEDSRLESTHTAGALKSSSGASSNDWQIEATVEEQERSFTIFQTAMTLLNDSNKASDRGKAYTLLARAATQGHPVAQRMMAVAHLFGDPEAGVAFDPTRAQQLLEPLSMSGDPEAQLYIGFMHSLGLGSLKPSQSKAIISYTFAAIGGNELAQMALAYRHYSGVGVVQSCEGALDYYRRVAGSVERAITGPGGFHYTGAMAAISAKRLSDEYENPSRQSNSQLGDDLIQYYQFLADKGDVHAQVGLGHLHYQGGRGVQQDHSRALTYFTQAANTGNANAMAYLGKMFLEGGKAVRQNNETAFRYFSMAAEKGNAVGQAGLGTMFLYGRGVPRDHDRALRYLTMAANQGLVDGQLELGNIFYHGLGVDRNYKMALKYYKQASAQGHVLAYYYLGMMNAQGIGVDHRSCHHAVELFKAVSERGREALLQLSQAYDVYKAGGKRVDEALVRYAFLAELGYEQAQSNAAFILDRAEAPLFKDRNTSYTWAFTFWGRAAAQGYVVARLKLGDYHYYGHGTPVDYTQSAFHYRVAVESDNDPQAMFNLAYMHEQGHGLPRDIHLAKRYYDLAAFTSVDAQIPVMLALLKLALVCGLRYLGIGLGEEAVSLPTDEAVDYSADGFFLLERVFGPSWDLYMMGVFAALFIGMAILRWPR